MIDKDLKRQDSQYAENQRLKEQVTTLQTEIERLAKLNHRWNCAASQHGPCGSEFHDEPENVFDRIQKTRRVLMDGVKRHIQLRIAAEAQNGKLRNALEEITTILTLSSDMRSALILARAALSASPEPPVVKESFTTDLRLTGADPAEKYQARALEIYINVCRNDQRWDFILPPPWPT